MKTAPDVYIRRMGDRATSETPSPPVLSGVLGIYGFLGAVHSGKQLQGVSNIAETAIKEESGIYLTLRLFGGSQGWSFLRGSQFRSNASSPEANSGLFYGTIYPG